MDTLGVLDTLALWIGYAVLLPTLFWLVCGAIAQVWGMVAHGASLTVEDVTASIKGGPMALWALIMSARR